VASSTATARRDGAAGFTLLEIIIVLVIIAMAATLVAPAVDAGFRAREVRSAVRGLAATMRSLQSDAVRKGVVQRLTVDPVQNAIQVQEREVQPLGDVAVIGELKGGELVAGGAVRVMFYPNGSTTGIDVVVAERGMPTREGYVVRLDPLIGLVTIVDPTR